MSLNAMVEELLEESRVTKCSFAVRFDDLSVSSDPCAAVSGKLVHKGFTWMLRMVLNEKRLELTQLSGPDCIVSAMAQLVEPYFLQHSCNIKDCLFSSNHTSEPFRDFLPTINGAHAVALMRYSAEFNLEIYFHSEEFPEEENHTHPLGHDLSVMWTHAGDGSLCDVSVIVADGTRIPAHKFILSARSEVLKAMFALHMTEDRDNLIPMEDFHPQAVHAFLTYLYTDKVPRNILSEHSCDLFVMADKYMVPGLRALCETRLVSAVSPDTASELLQFADMHGLQEVQARAAACLVQSAPPSTSGTDRVDANRISHIPGAL